MIRKSRVRFSGITDAEEQSHKLYHLVQDDFPGISFESNTAGKLRLDQNDGVPVPLAQIPDAAIRDVSLTFLADGDPVEWAAQPSALTEFLGAMRHRLKFDLSACTAQAGLSKFNQARLLVNVTTAGFTKAGARVQYSAQGLVWYYLDDSSGPSVGINTTGLKVSSWVNLCDRAKADVFLRLVGIDGDGVANPAFGLIAVQVR